MTDINHADLSRQLALALGYAPESARVKPNYGGGEHVLVYSKRGTHHKFPKWRVFDYRDPSVCLPLLEWLGSEYRKFFWYCSPTSLAGPRWSCSGGGIITPTLEEAVARAVIAVGVR
jgi:hypothetical protein